MFSVATSLILIAVSLLIYWLLSYKKKYSYWEKRGVPFVKPVLFFGNTKDAVLRRVPLPFQYQRIYNELDGHKFGGFYQLSQPILLLRDPDLIKDVFIKHFSHFQDHGFSLDEKVDPLGAHLLNQTGQRWKNIRQKMTPAFSTGKLKLMQGKMQECVDELNQYLTKKIDGDSKSGSVQNLKELAAKFTTDVIGACAFGFRCDSIRDEDSDFRRIGRLFYSYATSRMFTRMFLSIISPRLISLFNVKMIAPEVEEFFFSSLGEAAKHREASADKRNNFLHLMLDVQAEEKRANGHLQENGVKHSDKSSDALLFTDNVLAANMLLFFIGGFETISSTVSYCLYELTVNPDICQRVRDEVESVKRAHNGTLDYDSMRELTFLDAVISETLRKYPPNNLITRVCTETFQIPDSSVVVEKGTAVFVSMFSLHHDPKYFPEPEKFLPERFSPANKHSIRPGTYFPFGEGPRNCLGMRFAQFEMMSVLSYIVSNYTLHPCEKTENPLTYTCQAHELSPANGLWVRFEKICVS